MPVLPSLGDAEVLILLIEAFGAPRPPSNGLGELYYALAEAIMGFNPSLNLPSGYVYVSGLVNDNGTTDNTPAVTAAVALLPSTKGTLVFPSGTYGVDLSSTGTPLPADVTIMGQGPYSTILEGVTAKAGTQAAVIDTSNGQITVKDMEVNGGTGCTYGIYNNGLHSEFENLIITGGVIAALYEDTAAGSNHYLKVRTGAAQITKTKRVINGTIGTNGTTTVTDVSFVASDVDCLIEGTNIPQGSVILSVVPGTSATIDQTATGTNASGYATVFQGCGVVLLGLDQEVTQCVFGSGPTRWGGGGGLCVDTHITFLNPTGSAGLSSSLLEGPWKFSSCYFDSCPTGGVVGGGGGPTVIGVNIVHKADSASQTVMSGCEFYQNSSTSHNDMVVENDTTSSITFMGGRVNGTFSKAFGHLFNLTAGANVNLLVSDLWVGPNGVQNTAGVPNVYTSNTTSGAITLTFNGAAYAYNDPGLGPLTGDVTTIGDAATLVATTNVEDIIRLQSLNQMAAPTAGLNISAQRLIDVGTPQATTDGATAYNSLIGATYYEPGSLQVKNTASTSLVAIDTTDLTLSFTAISTVAVIELEASVAQLSGTTNEGLLWALFTHGTTTQVGYTTQAFGVANATTAVRVRATIRITGLSAGTAYQVDWAWASTVGTDAWVMGISGTAGVTNAIGPAIMRAYAG